MKGSKGLEVGLGVAVALVAALVAPAGAATALGTAFTYQGQLKDNGQPASGQFDFEFSLWDADTGGGLVGAALPVNGVTVANGLFTVELDFGQGAFNGDRRWLELRVRPAGGAGYTKLAPRQPLTAAPYALYALKAPWSGLSGVPAGFLDGVDHDSGGDITAVNAGAGLTGGGAAGGVTLSVGPGTGIVVGADSVSLDAAYAIGSAYDARFVNENQALSISTSMVQDDAVTAAKIAPNILSSLDGVSNDAGDIDLIAGANITIAPDDGANTITISATGGLWSANGDDIFNANLGGVGIGTPSPSTALEVNGTVTAAAFVGDGSGLTNLPGGNTLDQAYDQGGAGSGRTITADAGAVHIAGEGGLTVSGDVGIGTAGPTARLHVRDSGTDPVGLFRNVFVHAVEDGTAVAKLTVSSSAQRWPDNPVTAAGTISVQSSTASPDRLMRFHAEDADMPMEFHLNGARVLRLEPTATSPNLIGGFSNNSVTGGVGGATIAGGGALSFTNRVTDDYGTVAGGRNNQAGDNAGTIYDAYAATVGGGRGNTASGLSATVGGGTDNAASGGYATVGGGTDNAASGGYATVGGGTDNTASGDYATVGGGRENTASGHYSFAGGFGAQANARGTFAWADTSAAAFDVSVEDRFGARASGGVYFYTKSNLSTGSYLAANSGTWASVSDRNVKEGIQPVEPREVLEKLATVPVATWRYQGEDASIRHMGPMAQDLHAAFGLGDSEKSIGTIDADGISMAAIQGLHQIVEEKDAEIADLKARLAKVEALVAALASASTREE